MIDPALAFLYFGLPTIVGLIGLAAVKLHERSAPPDIAEGKTPQPGKDLPERAVAAFPRQQT